MTAVVTFVHCFWCTAEQTVIGPAMAPTCEYPGWRLSWMEFYNPRGHHYCPDHLRRAWQAYCCDLVSVPEDDIFECESCLTTGGIYVDVPDAMPAEEVVQTLNLSGVRCGGGREFFDVESVGEAHYLAIQPEVRAWL